jgi:alkaline phosphatase
MAAKGSKIWREYGALDYKECVGDDIASSWGGMPFIKLAKPKRGELVFFSWIVYKSKAQRDKIVAKVMKDPRLMGDAKSMPFDVKRMAWGGFKVLVD